jgi:hypothetical protein
MKPRHGPAYLFDARITGGTSGSTTIEAATLRLRTRGLACGMPDEGKHERTRSLEGRLWALVPATHR